MKAFIAHAIKHVDWGNQDDRTGWYIERIVFAVRYNKATNIISRELIAKFVGQPSEATSEAIGFNQSIASGDLLFLPDGWKLADLNTLMGA